MTTSHTWPVHSWLSSSGCGPVTVGSWSTSTGSRSAAQRSAHVARTSRLLSTSYRRAPPLALQNSDVKPGRSWWTCGRSCGVRQSLCGRLPSSPWQPTWPFSLACRTQKKTNILHLIGEFVFSSNCVMLNPYFSCVACFNFFFFMEWLSVGCFEKGIFCRNFTHCFVLSHFKAFISKLLCIFISFFFPLLNTSSQL